jgi:hypothetical protein
MSDVTQYAAGPSGARNCGFKVEGLSVLVMPMDGEENDRALALARDLAASTAEIKRLREENERLRIVPPPRSMAALEQIIDSLALWGGGEGQSICLGIDVSEEEMALLTGLPGAIRDVQTLQIPEKKIAWDLLKVTVRGVAVYAQCHAVPLNSARGKALIAWSKHKEGASNDQ